MKKGDNSPIPISATAYTDWVFIQWQGSGIVFADANSANTTVRLTGGDTTITAVFGDTLLGVPLMINDNGHGTTTPSGLQYVALGGITGTINVFPDTGYELYQDDWVKEAGDAVVNTVVAGTSYTITVNSLLTAIMLADFALKEYTLTVNDDGNGTTTPSGDITVSHGVARPIAATLTDPMKYVFSSWTVPIGTAAIGNASSTSTTATLTDGNATVQANFDKYGLYWTTWLSNSVNRSTFYFSDMEVLAGGSGYCAGVDLDIANEHVYYSDYNGRIWRCDLDGGNATLIYTHPQPGHYAIALDLISATKKIYFANYYTGIGRINLDGTGGYEVVMAGSPGGYRGVAVDGASGYVYAAHLNGIYRIDISGTLPQPPFFLLSASGAYEIDLDLTPGSEKMYWVEYYNNRCGSANLDGSAPGYPVPAGLSAPRGIGLDVANDMMYIANQGNNTIAAYTLSGTQIDAFPESGAPSGIAVDTD